MAPTMAASVQQAAAASWLDGTGGQGPVQARPATGEPCPELPAVRSLTLVSPFVTGGSYSGSPGSAKWPIN